MARQKREPLTARERQCQKVAREKSIRKRWHFVWVRLRIVLVGAVFGVFSAAGIWEYAAHGVSRTVNNVVSSVYAMTADTGFAVRSMVLEGRARTPLDSVTRALGVKRGEPIFALSLDDLRRKLETIPTVKHAAVERALPDRLYVRLSERVPVATWQNAGKLCLIDDEGTVMNDLALKDFRGLPLVIGEGAPAHIGEMVAILSAEPELTPLIAAAIRVGDRRWNIRLKDGIEVKLPEENALVAWQHVASMQREQKILHRAVRAIDLRASDRLYIQIDPAVLPSARSARET